MLGTIVNSLAIILRATIGSFLKGGLKERYSQAIMNAASLGIGVIFSALSVFLYQGAITLEASYLKAIMTPAVVAQVTAVGGLLIMAIGFNLLKIKAFKVGNMLPALFLPLAYNAVTTLLH